MNKYLVTAVRPSGNPNEGPIWTPRQGASKFAMCLNIPKTNKMCWVQPRNFGSMASLHHSVLAHGGLNKVNLVIADTLEEAPGDGSPDNMKQIAFGLGTTFAPADSAEPTMKMPLRAASIAFERGRSLTHPVMAIMLKPSYRDIAENGSKTAGGRSYDAELYCNNGSVEAISCVFWGPAGLRSNLAANTPYLVFGGRLTDMKKELYPPTLHVSPDTPVYLADREQFCPLFGLSPAVNSPDVSLSGDNGGLPVRRIKGAVVSHHPYETAFFQSEQAANVMVYPDDKNISAFSGKMSLPIMADMVGWDKPGDFQDMVKLIKTQSLLSEDGLSIAELDHVGSVITGVRGKTGEASIMSLQRAAAMTPSSKVPSHDEPLAVGAGIAVLSKSAQPPASAPDLPRRRSHRLLPRANLFDESATETSSALLEDTPTEVPHVLGGDCADSDEDYWAALAATAVAEVKTVPSPPGNVKPASAGKTDAIKGSVSASKKRGKKFGVEAFISTKFSDNYEPMVEVKYEEFDDTEWELFSHMRKELGEKLFKKLMAEMSTYTKATK